MVWPVQVLDLGTRFKNMKAEDKEGGFRGSIREIGPYIDLGMRFAISIALGVLVGWWLDSKLNTTPFLIIIGFLIGATAGFWSIYRVVYLKDQTAGREKKK